MMNKFKKLPPYGKQAIEHPTPHYESLIVITGSDAWKWAKSHTWFGRLHKLVLPFGENPSSYKWPVHDRDVMIFAFGKPESNTVILELSRCLLIHGANFVLWVLPDYPLTKVEAKRREAA